MNAIYKFHILLLSASAVARATIVWSGPVHEAARDGDVPTIRRIIAAAHSMVDARDSDGWTPLHCAAERGHKNIVELLLSENANVNARDEDGWTPLHWATAMAGPTESRLAKQVAVLNYKKVKTSKEKETMKFLLEGLMMTQNASPLPKNAFSPDMLILLQSHLRAYHDEIAQLLIANKASANATNNVGATPLHYAVWSGHTNLVGLLLDNKADVNGRDQDGVSPLHSAAYSGQRSMAIMLLAHKADPTAKNHVGWTPLHQAVWNEHSDVIDVLIPLFPDLDVFLCAGLGKVEKLRILLKNAPALVEAKDGVGMTSLHWATNCGRREAVEFLLAHGADVNARSVVEAAPLHLAASKGNKDLTELFVARGGDISAKDKNGQTPLHYAAQKGRKDVTELLLAKGADPNAKSSRGVTPLREAIQNDHTVIADLLRKHGGLE